VCHEQVVLECRENEEVSELEDAVADRRSDTFADVEAEEQAKGVEEAGL
jgi:hypothetical protein